MPCTCTQAAALAARPVCAGLRVCLLSYRGSMRACSNGVWRIALVLGLLWAATAGAGEGPAVPGAPGAAAPLPNSDPTAAFWDDYELYNQGYSSMPSADG